MLQKRSILKPSNSFALTLQKDNLTNGSNIKRINIKNVIELNQLINTSHEKVTIEINEKEDFSQLKELLKEKGSTKVKIKISNDAKIYTFELKNPRKFNFSTFNSIKDKSFVKKISF